jgi:hypothetical protein
LRLKNSYSNKEDRVSFSIQGVLCNDESSEIYEKDSECASDSDIDDFLESVYMTMNILEESIMFGEPGNIG